MTTSSAPRPPALNLVDGQPSMMTRVQRAAKRCSGDVRLANTKIPMCHAEEDERAPESATSTRDYSAARWSPTPVAASLTPGSDAGDARAGV